METSLLLIFFCKHMLPEQNYSHWFGSNQYFFSFFFSAVPFHYALQQYIIIDHITEDWNTLQSTFHSQIIALQPKINTQVTNANHFQQHTRCLFNPWITVSVLCQIVSKDWQIWICTFWNDDTYNVKVGWAGDARLSPQSSLLDAANTDEPHNTA